MSPDTKNKSVTNLWLAELGALLTLAVPLALTHLSQTTIGLTDTIMLGRYSETALAASVLGNTVYLFCWFIGLGPTSAISPMIAQIVGANPGDHDDTRAIVRMGLWSAGLISLPLTAVMFFTRPILICLGQDPALAEAASQFAIQLAFGLPFSLGFGVLRNYAVALSKAQPTFIVMALTVLVNALGDYALIFGHFGMPRLGLVGSGIASACSFAFSFLAMAAAIAIIPKLRAPRLLRHFNRPDPDKLREIVKLGLPISATIVMESGFYLFIHLVIGSFGAIYVAAHAIAWSVQNMTSLIPTGIGTAATVRVGLAAGAGDTARTRRAGYTAVVATTVFMALFGIVIAIFARQIAGLYLSGNAESVIAVAIPFLWIAAAYQIVDGIQAAVAFTLRGLKDVQAPMWIMAAAFWLIGLPICLGLAFIVGLNALGVWIGLAIALFAAAAMLTFRFYRLTRAP
jgi:MATE family multidrug resistance protein